MAAVDSWVERLKKAFKGWGTDEDEVYAVLTEAMGQMDALIAAYPELEDELYDEMSGKELQRALRLFYEVALPSTTGSLSDPGWVTTINDAFNAGFFGGTDEDTVYDVLQKALSAGQMNELACAYAKKFPGDHSLEDELYDELSGKELRRALQLYYPGLKKRSAQQASSDAYEHLIDGTLVPLSVELCLLDSNRKIVSDARCRRVDGKDSETVYVARNNDGVVRIPVELDAKSIMVEWGPTTGGNAGEEQSFALSQVVSIPGRDDDEDTVMAKMLGNAGFGGDNLAEQKNAYEQFFKESPANSADVYSALAGSASGASSDGSAIV